ncbi:MAG: hypothetical protein HZA90_03435 [Verrucomicrobia bacterium]|nr:hypothetical protein [Verrucomicrobiota bacterium]
MKTQSATPCRDDGIQKLYWLAFLALLACAPIALAQTRPYIGYTYPAGGQQGTTFEIKLGGQGLDDVNAVLVSGSGVKARVVEYLRRLNPQEMQLLGEQVRILRKATSAVASAMAPMMKSDTMMASENTMMMMSETGPDKKPAASGKKGSTPKMIAKIEKRTREYVQTPACSSISSLVIAEVTIAPNAEPGARELRLATTRGVSNPLVFHVGQVPESTRPPMITATIQVLGKEASALRKRPTNEVEVRINVPCAVNGQIASGEVNRYRFAARKGQRLVISTQARQLIPYVADAVPGWFQPVLTVHDANGKELAFTDDYRFRPDPVILFDVPKDGDYVFAITDAIYRGREDFVYRITIGELPFVTSIYPLGTQAGVPVTPRMKGWNLQDAVLTPPAKDAAPGIHSLVARRKGLVSSPMPFAVDKLPSTFDKDTNHTQATAQKITLPIIINGLINKPDDWDVFQFTGRSNETVAVEVEARRLNSPLDSVVKLTDAAGKVLAFSDDREDLAAGVNTHHADSFFMTKLPASGTYYVHIGDTARKGGEEYAYRLRISAPQPDFELRVVPSSVSLRTNSTASLTVYAQRKDGFAGPIKLSLKDAVPGFSASPVTLAANQNTARLTIKGPLAPTKEPVNLSIVGSAKLGEKEITHEAVPAEDRMQAFLWRHLVPADELKALVFDPGYEPPPARAAPALVVAMLASNAVAAAKATVATNAPVTNKTVAVVATNTLAGTNAVAAAKPKFSKSQVTRRLRELKLLFEEGLLTDDFYCEKVAECEAGQ